MRSFGLSALVFSFFLSAPLSEAQTGFAADDFSITLERNGCLGSCPDYKVTILGNGSVQYLGRAFVRIGGIRRKTVPIPIVQKLIQRLRDQDFFHWEEKQQVCASDSGAERKKEKTKAERPNDLIESRL